jgi:hypothetical protein
MVHRGIRAVCAAAGRARAVTPRPRKDTAALPNISICLCPRMAQPQRPLRVHGRLRAASIAAGRRGSSAHSRGESPSSPSIGSQSESSAAVPARPGRGDRITASVGRRRLQRAARVCGVSEWESAGVVGMMGVGDKMRMRWGCLWLKRDRQMQPRCTVGRASVISTQSGVRS